MKCNWCKKDIEDGTKVCPNCGKVVWNEKDKKALKLVGKIIGCIFAVLFIVIIIVAIPSEKVEDKCRNASEANLEEIYELHAKDVPKAEELYKDKYFKFTGTIEHKYKTYMQIQSNYVAADVYFAKDYKDMAFNYAVASKVTYCGKVEFGMSIHVKNAMIIKY